MSSQSEAERLGTRSKAKVLVALALAMPLAPFLLTSARTRPRPAAPVQTSFPLPKMRTTTLGSVRRYTRPGNCSGSYSTFSRPRPMAMALRFSSAPRSLVATMFWMVISGSSMVLKPLARSWVHTMPTAVWTSSMLLAPVQTTLPERKMRAAVLGSGTRKTRPGNCSGSYSALENVALMAFRSSSSPIEVLATTFWMWMTAMRRPVPVRARSPTPGTI